MMANVKKRKTTVIRSDPEFQKFVRELSRYKSAQENDNITSARITQAMFNQYKKYPQLLEEFKRVKLGRWKP